MTEHDVNVARDIGGLQADMRTVKHDVANISGKIDGLSTQISGLNLERGKSLGFVAGASAVIGVMVTCVVAAVKLIVGVHA